MSDKDVRPNHGSVSNSELIEPLVARRGVLMREGIVTALVVPTCQNRSAFENQCTTFASESLRELYVCKYRSTLIISDDDTITVMCRF